MKRCFSNLNVLLDVMLERPGAPIAAQIWAALEKKRGEGYVPAHGLDDCLLRCLSHAGRVHSRSGQVDGLMRAFAVAPGQRGCSTPRADSRLA